MASHISGLELGGLQGWLEDQTGAPWVSGRVGEGGLKDAVLWTQVVVERGSIWAIKTVVQVIWARTVFIAWPEVDPGLPLCLNSGHVAQLSIDLCRGGGREGAGLQLLRARAWLAGSLSKLPQEKGLLGDWYPLGALAVLPPAVPKPWGWKTRPLLCPIPLFQGRKHVPLPRLGLVLQGTPHQSFWGDTEHTAGSRPRHPDSSILCRWSGARAGVGCTRHW